jgi:hypothetical protein
MIYFVKTTDNRYIKIGYTKDPLKRIAGLQTGSAQTLRLVAVRAGDAQVEHNLHRSFSDYAASGEWFYNSKPIIDEAMMHAQPINSPSYINYNIFLSAAKHELVLLALYKEACLVGDDSSQGSFCANAVWCGYDGWPGIKHRVERYVGWDAKHAQLQSTEVYDAVYETIYESLPDCRSCSCIH